MFPDAKPIHRLDGQNLLRMVRELDAHIGRLIFQARTLQVRAKVQKVLPQ